MEMRFQLADEKVLGERAAADRFDLQAFCDEIISKAKIGIAKGGEW
jgi:hypothetical protein